jgi:hypothetical protein
MLQKRKWESCVGLHEHDGLPSQVIGNVQRTEEREGADQEANRKGILCDIVEQVRRWRGMITCIAHGGT